jgi:hypothetical protein
MRLHRRLATSGLAAACLLLAGCSVPVSGVSALTRNAKGQIVVVIEMCRGAVDNVILYESNDDHPEQSVDHGSWDSSPGRLWSATQFIADSSAPPTPWSATIPWNGSVPAGHTWTLLATTRDASASSYPLSFTQDDLDRLRPGKILVPLVTVGGGAASQDLLDPEQLHDLACTAAS